MNISELTAPPEDMRQFSRWYSLYSRVIDAQSKDVEIDGEVRLMPLEQFEFRLLQLWQSGSSYECYILRLLALARKYRIPYDTV